MMATIVAMALVAVAASASASETRKPATATAASQGVEPDEIDAKQRSQAPAARPARVAAPARKPPVGTVPTPGRFAPAVDPDGNPQAYETADCSSETKTITCCTNTGEGGSCNLFLLLCEEAGGTGKGDAGDAICVE
ncbi:hypothetical protein N788_02450 [Arenimonas donghaensis DSM 18148 = HO3-R19]|uniref:WAP domain-containing protein n=2 Tax=Arenimonas TaxID=490567 RepID=A0A087MMF2_9GAMM|nr:hypothetical protein N788_02450 [Arenimonas donghaensis DSM 18148 = HO3-R19]